MVFELEIDFVGVIIGKGIFRVINGINCGFMVKFYGIWMELIFIFVEDFFYDDGEIDKKIWVFICVDENWWIGIWEDVIGEVVVV